MTRKHYIVWASIIKDGLRDATSPQAQEVVAKIARAMAREFSELNPRFRFATFYLACGLDSSGYVTEGASL